MKTMQLVEQHVIHHNDPRWSIVDSACFLSKNLYNAANYVVRQEYIFNRRYIAYRDLDKLMQHQVDYCALPAKVSQWVLKQLNRDWKSFFAAQAEYFRCPEKFSGKPKLPKYKHKTDGRNLLTYTRQAISRRAFEEKGVLQPSRLDITIKTLQKTFDQVRVVPRKTHYIVEVVYTVSLHFAKVDPERVAALDLGVDNLATVTFNQPELAPLLVNGRPLKSINQLYNKQRARLQSQLPKDQKTSSRMEGLTDKRNRRINTYLHIASRRLIDLLCILQVGTLVIGKNVGWKQDVRLGKRNNQTFVNIPHSRFIKMLVYKAELVGIKVILTEESYTSKCSFLDLEPIGKHKSYAGQRIYRGLFRAGNGRCLNADVNGSYNILRKVIPNAFGNGIEAAVVQPLRVTPA
jgi:putative transposase